MNRAARRAATRVGKRPRHTASREVTAALHEAIRRHREGDLAAAEVVYHKALDADARNADALHFLGVLRHQQGRSEEGIALVRRALDLAPAYVDAWSNLGNLYKECGRLDEAEDAYVHALAVDKRHVPAWNNLGVVFRARGKPTEAAHAYRHATELAPAFVDAHYNLGNTLRELGRFGQAIGCYRQVLSLAPTHTPAHYQLGYALHVTGQRDEAARVFEQWHAVEPANPVAAHMAAAYSGKDVPERASDDYVRSTFDRFASSFDEILLHRLDYHAPELLVETLVPVLGVPAPVRDVLDAGCGTGLCAALLKPYARTLAGVDLSCGMLAKARARALYDALHEDEITRFLAAHGDAFDLVASADTLCYFGDLANFAQSARHALRAGGWIGFTVERGDDVDTYRILPHGRYCHARDYVESTLAQAGFDAVHVAPAILRRELGADVRGWVVRAQVPRVGATANSSRPSR